MSVEATGPVSVGEVQAVVVQLREMSARAAECGQEAFHFVLAMGAESLADNLESAADMDNDDAPGHD